MTSLIIMKKWVPDTSVLINGKLTGLVEKNEVEGEIIVPVTVIDELQAQASRGRDIGFQGLEELKKVRALGDMGKKVKLVFTGRRPTMEEIMLAKKGRLDALIRDIARENVATLITADYVQALVAEAEGVSVLYIQQTRSTSPIKLEDFFDEKTSSVHLKVDVLPMAKKGKPGEVKLVRIRDTPITEEEIEALIKEILDRVRHEKNAFIEMGSHGAMVIQFDKYRIAIARKPFSDGLELTAVRPITKLVLADYKLSEKLMERLKQRAEGIIICGPPGSGKCLPGFEKVYTANGEIKSVKDVCDDKSAEILSVAPDGSVLIKRPTRFFSRKVGKLLRIVTRTGRELCLTEEHPLLAIKDGWPRWVQANEVREGEKIAAIKKLPVNSEVQKINFVDVLDEDKIWIRLSKGIDYEFPVEEMLMGQKKEIVRFIRNKPFCTSKDVTNSVKGHPREVHRKLLNLYRRGLLTRTRTGRGGNTFYSHRLVKNTWKPAENEEIMLKTFKLFVKDRCLSLEKAHEYVRTIFKRDTYHHSAEIKLPLLLSPEIAEFLGYYVGESIKKIGISTDTETARKRFKEISENVFGLQMKEAPEDFSVYTDKYGTIDHLLTRCFNCVSILENKRSYKHTIPSLLFKATNHEIAAFLRAYLSTEGSMDTNKGCIEAVSASENLIRGVQNLLLRFGVVSIVSKKVVKKYPKNTYYRLFIYGYRNRKLFYDNIGFLDEKKQRKLIESLNRQGFRSTELVPAGHILKILNSTLNLGFDNYDLTKNEYSQERLNRYVALVENSGLTEKTQQLVSLLKFMGSDYVLWDEVLKSEVIEGEFDVYDFEIPDVHNFMAGSAPIIVHNSTFAASMAEFYLSLDNIVKTIENPRDLQVPPEITQYGPLDGSLEKTADILLLVRPDYTVYDEVRKTKDFELFADMRMAGVGMIGVVHASDAIDSLQRFIGRIEMGMITSVIDTIIFLKGGGIRKVYELGLVVRVPTGMTEADLSRPLIEVRDFETGQCEYEIYTYGEENVVVPVTDAKTEQPIKRLAKERVLQEIRKFDPQADVEIVSDNKAVVRVDNELIAHVIGKEGRTVMELEKKLGISIDVEPLAKSMGKPVSHTISESGAYINIGFDIKMSGRVVSVYIDDEFLFSATVGSKDTIKVSKDSDIGSSLMRAVVNRRKIKCYA